MAEEKSYEELVDPDYTAKDGETDGGPDPRRPNLGTFGPDVAEDAQEDRDKWETENLNNDDK